MENKRYVCIDILRILSCFLVIVNHTNSRIFLNTTPSFTWFLSLTYFFICKVAVPIFVMISGYTMLHRMDNYKKIIGKVIRILFVWLIFSLFYYVDDYINGVRTVINVKDFILTILNNPVTNAFWYLYLYIGILIMLPFLQKFVSVLNKKDFQIFFGISLLIFAIYPIIEHLCPSLDIYSYVMIPLFDSYICILMIGYYIKKYVTLSKKKFIISGILFLGACAFNVSMTYIEYQRNYGTDYLFYDNRIFLPIIIESVCLFYMVLHVKIGENISRILKIISECTFGIYLFSDFLIERLIFIYTELYESGVYCIFAVIIFEIVVFVVGGICTYLLKRVPCIKSFL